MLAAPYPTLGEWPLDVAAVVGAELVDFEGIARVNKRVTAEIIAGSAIS